MHLQKAQFNIYTNTRNASTNTLISMWYQVKATPPALRNASAAHQKPVDVLLLGILQLGKYYLNSLQMEIRRAGQGPEAPKEQRGWVDHSWTGSKVTHKVTANLQYLNNNKGNNNKDKLSFKTQPSDTFCWTVIPSPISISSCLRTTHMLSNSMLYLNTMLLSLLMNRPDKQVTAYTKYPRNKIHLPRHSFKH